MARQGRPKLDDDTARGRRVIIRFTDAEAAQLAELATAAGLSMSEYVRGATLQGRVKTPRRSTTGEGVFSRDDRAALQNIGNNLNQAVRVMHGGREFAAVPQLVDSAKKLDAVLDRYLPK